MHIVGELDLRKPDLVRLCTRAIEQVSDISWLHFQDDVADNASARR